MWQSKQWMKGWFENIYSLIQYNKPLVFICIYSFLQSSWCETYRIMYKHNVMCSKTNKSSNKLKMSNVNIKCFTCCFFTVQCKHTWGLIGVLIVLSNFIDLTGQTQPKLDRIFKWALLSMHTGQYNWTIKQLYIKTESQSIQNKHCKII